MKHNYTIEEVRTMLNNEMNKNSKDRDYDKISELTKTYAVLTDTEDEIEQAAQSGIVDTLSKIRPEIEEMPEAVPVITHTGAGWFRNVAAVAACLVVSAGTIGGVSALKRAPLAENVQTAEETAESVTETAAKTETQPQTEKNKPETKKHEKQVLAAVPETTISTDTTEIMTSAIETEIVPVIQEITTTVTVLNTEAPTSAQVTTETELITETAEPEIITEDEPELITIEENNTETIPVIIAEAVDTPETEPVTEAETQPQTDEFGLVPAETDENGFPILDGFTVEYLESEYVHKNYIETDPLYRIMPIHDENSRDELAALYGVTYAPEGVEIPEYDEQSCEEYIQFYLRWLGTVDTYNCQYHYSDRQHNPIEFAQVSQISKQCGVDALRIPAEEMQQQTFYPTTVSGNPAFITRTVYEEGFWVENDDLELWGIRWVQDGYRFSLYQFVNNRDGNVQKLLPELMKMAESVQPFRTVEK